jgi:hypothetical protein
MCSSVSEPALVRPWCQPPQQVQLKHERPQQRCAAASAASAKTSTFRASSAKCHKRQLHQQYCFAGVSARSSFTCVIGDIGDSSETAAKSWGRQCSSNSEDAAPASAPALLQLLKRRRHSFCHFTASAFSMCFAVATTSAIPVTALRACAAAASSSNFRDMGLAPVGSVQRQQHQLR